jgi:hypothetical protein
MAKFIYLYNGPATPPEQMSPQQAKKEMQAWGAWMEKIGKAMVDMGQPMAQSAAVVDDGSSRQPTQLNGYSIVEADSLEAAKDMAEGHPFLSEGKGRFSVDIYELMPAPSM